MNCDDVGVPDGKTLLADKLLPAPGLPCAAFHSPAERTPAVTEYAFTVKLPDIECDNCAIQVIQIMTDASKHPDGIWNPAGGKGLYFRCSNVRLSRTIPPNPDNGADPDSGSNPDPDSNPNPGSEPDAEPDPDPEPDPTDPGGAVAVNGGCATSGNTGPLAAVLVAFALGLAARRRRHRR
jgi:uncharacterized protein (TIGR03382 family)